MDKSKLLTFLVAFIIILYFYYVIYYVEGKTKKNVKIKKILLNNTFLFISCIFVIVGSLNLTSLPLYIPSQIASFVIPMTLIVIEI
jgi:hypothetical protein